MYLGCLFRFFMKQPLICLEESVFRKSIVPYGLDGNNSVIKFMYLYINVAKVRIGEGPRSLALQTGCLLTFYSFYLHSIRFLQNCGMIRGKVPGFVNTICKKTQGQ